MEKYLVPQKPSSQIPKRVRRTEWERSLIELKGKFEPNYRHYLSSLLIHSYSQLERINFPVLEALVGSTFRRGISSLQFDTKGVYLVSVSNIGCLTVHDFESLYCQANSLLPSSVEDENKHVLHLFLDRQLDVVRWNIANQDEVACTSIKSNAILIFDIAYISSDPVEVLRTRRIATVHGSEVRNGLTDIAFTALDKSRLIASDSNGKVNVWDRKMGVLPCLELITNCSGTINSIQVNVDNQMVFGAGRDGTIYMWDLRGGRGSAPFQTHKEVCHLPLTSWKIASALEKIGDLKAQSAIVPKEVHSIDFDPSFPNQLAFHLDDGWSGVLDIYKGQVTHVHCPPPAWLHDLNGHTNTLSLRKPSWLPTYSIYAIGASTDNGIHLLDFYPDSNSPCHVEYIGDVERHSSANKRSKQNKFVPLTESPNACAAHPINGTIVVATKNSSLLVVSQQKQCVSPDNS
ncbi:uncharacterized protein LOC126675297 isoform X2 [Mercurialis annua]|uniref:uncharacterized protein LOC126675297 isoform X2 n=1 Tax=Mercurialis annua TaxID=3986 RepID=UPI00216071EB|nr:uncharacterized protein LOC126675297 isoform X2 [Mercurialis annua]